MTLPRLQNFIKEGHYHIYNRGNNKQEIFYDGNDYVRYLRKLTEFSKRHQISILAYCLMPNHIHLLVRQDTDSPLTHFIHRLHTAYTMYFNKRHEKVGHLFQGPFKAKIIESDEYLVHLSRYIHINPCPEIVKKPEDYTWSSYLSYIGTKTDGLIETQVILSYFGSNLKKAASGYRLFVESEITKEDTEKIENLRLE